ncbi:DUF397 domain-containing protein [Kitasatospora sp. NBC_00374]|uniref:DUF397 domain-containing protein n=1 Tax=Kitasatospora sp. NBC_00374 TaxID=2975964 RepID=UPI0030E1A757
MTHANLKQAPPVQQASTAYWGPKGIVTADEKNSLDPTWVQAQYDQAEWQTASSGGTNCVEIAFLARGLVGMRDSLNPDQHPLLFTEGEYDDFVDGLTAGKLRRR